jgi:DNA-binding response OmpR family regulator
MRLLIVEDDPAVGPSLLRAFEQAGYATDLSTDGEDALARLTLHPYDAALLDLRLPKKGGLSVLTELRARQVDTPVLVITARDAVADRVLGLDAGADDYLVKPFAVDEALARVRALLRRGRAPRPAVLAFEDLRLDPATRIATRGGVRIELTRRELGILEYFLRNPEIVLTRAMIGEHVWDDRFEPSFSNVIDVHIRNLRKKVDAAGKPLIHTVRGAGYVLRSEP